VIALPTTRLALAALLLVACMLGAAASADRAGAQFGITNFDGEVAADSAHTPFTQAGGHPYSASTSFELNRVPDPQGFLTPAGGGLKTVAVDLPPGLVGNPRAVPRCPKDRIVPSVVEAVFAETQTICPVSTIVGIAALKFTGGSGNIETSATPVFNLEPPPGVAAQFGFSYINQKVFLDARLREDGSYGITISGRYFNQGAPLYGSSVTLWGVPADPSHDFQRCIVFPTPMEHEPVPTCVDFTGGAQPLAGPNRSDAAPVPFLTNPTRCTAPGEGLTTTLRAESWTGGATAQASFESHNPPGSDILNPIPPEQRGEPQGPTGCEDVPFDPAMDVRPTSSRPGAPTGLRVDITMPTDGLLNRDGLAQAHLKWVRVTLPEGMTINPAGAGGLEACTDAQLALNQAVAPTCPEAAKIGSATIETPLLDEPLEGGIYVRTQASGDPGSGDLFRIAIVIDDARTGVRLKLPGRVAADPGTGRLVATFDDNPQVPFSRLSLTFKDGPRAPLANPESCGVKTAVSELSPWSAADPDNPTPAEIVTTSSTFAIDCPGQEGFAPSFVAGTMNPAGGAFSPFALQIARADGQEYLSGVTVDLPPGLIAKLRGVPLCAGAAAGGGACPEASRIGTATVEAGPGSSPFRFRGPVYLTEGYKGGPYGLAVHVPAKAGPFDLGMVRVRQAIYVDPVSAELTVASDPLPQIVSGVPVRLRGLRVDVDRPGFTLNPTSCSEKAVTATLAGAAGTVRQVSTRFQVGSCQALPLRPRLALRLTGRRQTTDGRHPGLRAVLTQPGGQSNLERVTVRLPLSLALDPANAQALCEFEAGQRVDCPASSIIGRARAVTPVLENPLTGPVYFVKGVRTDRRTGSRIRTFPTLLIPLRGDVAIDLRATTTVRNDKLVNTFPTIPDAPVSRFELNLKGGKGGIIVVTGDRNLCRGRHVAEVEIDGHNGKRRDFQAGMKTPCAPRKRKAGRKAR
jgi:hypothetical protein